MTLTLRGVRVIVVQKSGGLRSASRGQATIQLQRFYIARSGLKQQILQRPSVVEATLHFRDEILRNVHCETPPLQLTVQDVTGGLFA
jgi:hypothetical protein